MVQTGTVRVNGGGVFEIDPANAEVAIQAAIDTLGTNGGVLDFAPAAVTYQFSGAVTIPATLSNVIINGGGSTFAFNGATSLYGWRVRSANTTFRGCRFEDTAASSLGTGTRRIVSIEDNAVDMASNTTKFLDCYFKVTLATQIMHDYQCISVLGNSDTNALMRRGLVVTGCTFVAGVNSVPNQRFATGVVPNGITFIRTENSGSTFIHSNEFRGDIGSSTLTDGTGDPLDTIQVNATVASGTSMDWKSSGGSLNGVIQAGSTFTVAGDATVYKVTKLGTANGTTVTVNFWPTLAVQADLNDAVTVTLTSAYGHVASAIHLIDHNQSIVRDNVFTFLSTQAAASGEGGALIYSETDEGESGHSKVASNLFEDVDAWWVVRVEGLGSYANRWMNVEFNDFGRIIPKCEAVVSYSMGGACKVIGNSFHNIGGGPHGTVDTNGYPIDLLNCRTVLIDLNVGSIMDTTESLYHDSGGNQNIRYGQGNVLEWDY